MVCSQDFKIAREDDCIFRLNKVFYQYHTFIVLLLSKMIFKPLRHNKTSKTLRRNMCHRLYELIDGQKNNIHKPVFIDCANII